MMRLGKCSEGEPASSSSGSTCTEFMKLPAGVIFCSGQPWCFGELCVKGETWDDCNDFIELGLQWVDGQDSGEVADRMDQMLELGASFPLQTDFGRNGMFDDKDVFLVYEEADLAQMIQYFEQGMEVAKV